MARWLNTNVAADTADGVTRRQLYRLSAANKLISDVDRWMQHHDARNTTSHIYDSEKAQQVYEAVKVFTQDAPQLLKALEARND